MTDNTYQDGQDMMDIDFSEMNPGGRNRNLRGRGGDDREKLKKLVVYGAAALLCVVLLIIAFSLFSDGKSGKDSLSPLEARVKALEESVAHVQGMEEGLTTVQARQEALEKSLVKLEASLKSVKSDLHKISREVAHLRKGRVANEKTARQAHHRYHVVQKGESPYKVAKKYGISVEELFRLNHLTKKSVIYPGQKLVVGSAKKK